MEALHQLGVGDSSRHFIVVSEGDLDVGGIPVVVLAKRTAFTDAEREQAREFLKLHPALVPLYLEPATSLMGRGLQPAYVPSGESFAELIQSNQPRQFAERYPYDISPVTDNAPFFFFTLKTGQVLSRTTPQGIDWKVNLGVAVLGMVLVISLVAVLGFLLVPLAWAGGRNRQRALPLLYFVAIGLGYIMVEIAFIQRFVLFLGHPTYALTVVIFLLLLSSGAGSLASRQWLSRAGRGWTPLPLIVGVLAVYVFALPGVLASLVGLPFGVKLVVSGIFLVPLGFAMGMPFPTGLRALARMPARQFAAADIGAGSTAGASKENAVEWAWAMNAAASVFGSVVAMAIAVHFGLNATLACGAIAYLSALALFGNLEPAGDV
jgi:hypothetical protein